MSAATSRATGFQQKLATGLTIFFGLHLLRSYLALSTFYFYTTRGVDPLLTALVALVFFSAGAVAPALASRFGAARVLQAVTISLAASRLAEQIVGAPAVDLWVAAAGVVFFALAMPLLVMVARDEVPGAGANLGLAMAMGAAGDLALHTALGTLDLSWQSGAWPLWIVTPLAALLVVAALGIRTDDRPTASAQATSPLAAGFALLGCWFYLELVVFQNVASLAARSARPLPQAALTVAVAAALGLLAAARLVRGGEVPRGARPLCAAGLLAALLPIHQGGLWSLGGYLLGAGFAAPWLVLQTARLAGAIPRRGTTLTAALIAWSAPVVLLTLLFFHYGSFDFPLGVTSGQVVALAAVILLLGSLERDEPALNWEPPPQRLVAPLVAAALLPLTALTLWFTWRAPRYDDPSATVKQVRTMTYNLHQGFDTRGHLAPEALARVIEASGAELVALQEVSRGWVINGSFDLLEWLSERLGMPAVFGPTAGPNWGNAILSRYPLGAVANRPLPPPTLRLRRGYLAATVELGGPQLQIFATHLHHTRWAQPIRELQTRTLLEQWGQRPNTLLLGDLNSTPDNLVIGLLRQAGLHSAADLLPLDRRPTHLRKGARQLDYIWATPDLTFTDTETPFSEASDHLPVVTTVLLP